MIDNNGRTLYAPVRARPRPTSDTYMHLLLFPEYSSMNINITIHRSPPQEAASYTFLPDVTIGQAAAYRRVGRRTTGTARECQRHRWCKRREGWPVAALILTPLTE